MQRDQIDSSAIDRHEQVDSAKITAAATTKKRRLDKLPLKKRYYHPNQLQQIGQIPPLLIMDDSTATLMNNHTNNNNLNNSASSSPILTACSEDAVSSCWSDDSAMPKTPCSAKSSFGSSDHLLSLIAIDDPLDFSLPDRIRAGGKNSSNNHQNKKEESIDHGFESASSTCSTVSIAHSIEPLDLTQQPQAQPQQPQNHQLLRSSLSIPPSLSLFPSLLHFSNSRPNNPNNTCFFPSIPGIFNHNTNYHQQQQQQILLFNENRHHHHESTKNKIEKKKSSTTAVSSIKKSEQSSTAKKTKKSSNRKTNISKNSSVNGNDDFASIFDQLLVQHDHDQQDHQDQDDCGSSDGTNRNNNNNNNYKNMTVERRMEANARERTRVHTIGAAFDRLRKLIPSLANDQKLSKLSILRIACRYIMLLAAMNDMDYSVDRSAYSIEDCVEMLSDTINVESKFKRVP